MRLRTPLVTFIAAAPLLLGGLAVMMPSGAASADTSCPTWNGDQPASPDPSLPCGGTQA